MHKITIKNHFASKSFYIGRYLQFQNVINEINCIVYNNQVIKKQESNC